MNRPLPAWVEARIRTLLAGPIASRRYGARRRHTAASEVGFHEAAHSVSHWLQGIPFYQASTIPNVYSAGRVSYTPEIAEAVADSPQAIRVNRRYGRDVRQVLHLLCIAFGPITYREARRHIRHYWAETESLFADYGETWWLVTDALGRELDSRREMTAIEIDTFIRKHLRSRFGILIPLRAQPQSD